MADKNYIYHETGNVDNKPQRLQDSIAIFSVNDFIKMIVALLINSLFNLYKAFLSYFKSPKSISGRICLVTGAGRGLGRGLCLRLASLGAEVVCVDIREDANMETVKLIKEAGGKAHGYVCNVAKYDEVTRLAETVQKEVGRVYLLVNNAALIMVHKAGEWQPEDVTSMFNVNVISHYWAIKSFLPAMMEVNEGHIVNVVSAAAFLPVPSLSVYGPTKAAVDNLVRTLRIELNFNKKNKIEVSGVYPLVINTSEDIANIFCGGLKMVPLSNAVDDLIDGIIYERRFIVIPKFTRHLLHYLSFLPESLYAKLYDILNISIEVPSEATKEKKPFGEIRHKCL